MGFLEFGFLNYRSQSSKVNKKQNYQDTTSNYLSEENVKQYVLERFAEIKKEKKIKSLVCFQAMNKYMIMAHDQEELKNLGNLVAGYKKISFEDVLENYEKHLINALENYPTIKKHFNVILHIFGYFFKNLNQQEKKIFLNLLERYKEKKITLGKTLLEINHIIFRFNNTYLASQTYFLLYSDSQTNIFSIM